MARDSKHRNRAFRYPRHGFLKEQGIVEPQLLPGLYQAAPSAIPSAIPSRLVEPTRPGSIGLHSDAAADNALFDPVLEDRVVPRHGIHLSRHFDCEDGSR